ncbi:MAG: hypothetical protein AB2816_20390 [Candidatus Thiodiazotropha endolucinida]
MKSVIKQIIGCLAIAILLAVACYFMPVVNGLFGGYLFGFFLAAFAVPLGIKGYEAHMIKVRAMSEAERRRRQKECDAWHKEGSEAMTSATHSLDYRNIDRLHHNFSDLHK